MIWRPRVKGCGLIDDMRDKGDQKLAETNRGTEQHKPRIIYVIASLIQRCFDSDLRLTPEERMVFNPFLKQFMYGIHTPDPEIPIVINNLENPIYKEEEKNKLHVRINLPNID